MEHEIWKSIDGYEGLYEVSSYGKIKNVKKNRLNKLHINEDGYCQLTLSNKTAKQFRVHRLVAVAFIPNPDNKPVINHKDGNKQNNHVSNLEWVTTHENTLHAHANGLVHPYKRAVAQYNFSGELIKVWPSAAEAQRNGYHNAHIIACCRRKLKHHKYFIWRYAE